MRTTPLQSTSAERINVGDDWVVTSAAIPERAERAGLYPAAGEVAFLLEASEDEDVVLGSPKNFDGDVYWFRRLASHPRRDIEAAAKEFRDAVARDLKLKEPYPEIVWFEPMDHVEAATKWSAATCEQPDVGWGIDDNPFTTPVDVFRFPNDDCETVVHGGYRHKDGPRLIGILTEQPAEQVFGCIAHESVHVCQDDRHGPGWRMANIAEAEAEAWKYQEQVKSEVSKRLNSSSR